MGPRYDVTLLSENLCFSPRRPARTSMRTRPCPWWSPKPRTPSSTTKHMAPSSGSAPTGSLPPATKTRDGCLCPDMSSLISPRTHVEVNTQSASDTDSRVAGQLEVGGRQEAQLHSLGTSPAQQLLVGGEVCEEPQPAARRHHKHLGRPPLLAQHSQRPRLSIVV